MTGSYLHIPRPSYAAHGVWASRPSSRARLLLSCAPVQIKDGSQGFIVTLEPGDELVRCLTAFARQNDVDSGLITGFGTIAEVELGVVAGRPNDRRFCFRGPLEACSLQGTIMLLDGEPFPHVHGVFARADFSTVGGHVFQAVCATVVELVVQPWAEPLHVPGGRYCVTTWEGVE
jgi:predicted DNA-binding protein with PD1-like motif